MINILDKVQPQLKLNNCLVETTHLMKDIFFKPLQHELSFREQVKLPRTANVHSIGICETYQIFKVQTHTFALSIFIAWKHIIVANMSGQ